MLISKTFYWEAAHRLRFHNGKCRNLHGHSYKMVVELTGKPDEHGMILDFGELSEILQPMLKEMDHSTIICRTDTEILDIFRLKQWKHFILPYEPTAENISSFFLSYLSKYHINLLSDRHIVKVSVKIYESTSSYAESDFIIADIKQRAGI